MNFVTKSDATVQILIIFIILFAAFNCHLHRAYTWDEFKEMNDGNKKNKAQEVINGDTVQTDYALYRISAPVSRFCNNNGFDLTSPEDFIYDQELDFYDYNNGDIPLGTGKYLRINYNGINIAALKELGGLEVTPVAKDLSNEENIKNLSPPRGRFYIDPVTGRFILPRPVYWSDCSDETKLQDANIGRAIIENYNNRLTVTTLPHKFGSGIKIECVNARKSNDKYLKITPDCNNSVLDKEGSISLWIRGDYTGDLWIQPEYTPYIFKYYFNESDYVSVSLKLELYTFLGIPLPIPPKYLHRIGYTVNGSTCFANYSIRDEIKHIFITYSNVSGIDIYANNQKILPSSEGFTPSNNPNMLFQVNGTPYLDIVPLLTFDNIKIWNKKMDNPSFEYNDNLGRPDALHDIYKYENDYKPPENDLKAFYYFTGK